MKEFLKNQIILHKEWYDICESRSLQAYYSGKLDAFKDTLAHLVFLESSNEDCNIIVRDKD